MIGSTISHYKILEKLGEGGMSQSRRRACLPVRQVISQRVVATLSLLAENVPQWQAGTPAFSAGGWKLRAL